MSVMAWARTAGRSQRHASASRSKRSAPEAPSSSTRRRKKKGLPAVFTCSSAASSAVVSAGTRSASARMCRTSGASRGPRCRLSTRAPDARSASTVGTSAWSWETSVSRQAPTRSRWLRSGSRKSVSMRRSDARSAHWRSSRKSTTARPGWATTRKVRRKVSCTRCADSVGSSSARGGCGPSRAPAPATMSVSRRPLGPSASRRRSRQAVTPARGSERASRKKPARACDSAAKGTPREYWSNFPRSSRAPATVAGRCSSNTSDVLPMPGSPESSTAPRAPPTVSSRAAVRRASSASRPWRSCGNSRRALSERPTSSTREAEAPRATASRQRRRSRATPAALW